MPWSEIVSGAVGGIIVLLANGLRKRWRDTNTAKGLAVALWEELQAVEFSEGSDGKVRFGGFSSQVFDTLFADVAHLFPEDLARRVMRYHWRMKFLVERRTTGGTSKTWHEMAAKAVDQHESLTKLLEDVQERPRLKLFLGRFPPVSEGEP